MTATAPEQVPIWLKPPAIIAFVATVVAIRLYLGAATGLVRDEGYYTLWSFYPQLGYLDHPPMVAWLIAAGRALLGENEGGVRLLMVLSSVIVSFAIYRTGRALFDGRTAGLAVIWYNLTPAGGLLFIATPDAPVVMFWTLALWCVAEFAVRRDPSWWLAAGLFAGLGLLSKYTAVFLGLGLLLYLLGHRERWAWFRLWQLWAGGVLALLVFVPNLIWNVQRGWASFGFQGRRFDNYGIDLGGLQGNFVDLLGGQFLAGAGLLFIFALIGIVMFFARVERAGRRNLALPVLTSLPMILYFLAYIFRFRVEANWLLPVWPMLALAGAWAAIHLRPKNQLADLPLAIGRWAMAPLGLVLLAVIYTQALWQPFEAPQSLDRTRDMRGWREMFAELENFAVANGAMWIATAEDYGLTGELAAQARFAQSSLVVRPLDEPVRWEFLPPADPALAEAPALFVEHASQRDLAGRFFTSVELVGEARRMQGGEEELERFEVYLVSAPTVETRRMLAGD
jgi:4-amino-4-deoxy-L-arabinose transferase-like glycosyltransferase